MKNGMKKLLSLVMIAAALAALTVPALAADAVVRREGTSGLVIETVGSGYGEMVLKVITMFAGLFIIVALDHKKVRGAVLYGIAGKSVHRYMHSVFHIFVVVGSILQYFCILFYVM